MRSEYQSLLAAGVERKYRMLEEEIMKDVIRRVRKAGKITSTADYQIHRYLILGHSTEDVEGIIRRTVGYDWPETFQLYDKVIEWEYVRSRSLYEQINARFIPYEQNAELQQLTRALIQQSNDELFNITKSMGFMVDMGCGRKVFSPLSDIYNGYLDNAITMMASGAFDYNTMIRRVVGEMTASGLRTVDYASGRSNRVDVAARRALMTGVGQLTGQISRMNGQALGTDKYEVDWHPGARPGHAVWQGRVWTYQQLVEVCGLGTGPGLLGWNCRHTYYPFLEGISVRNYSDEWLRAMDEKEARKILYKGREYSAYEATQKQRQMETVMRAQREKVELLKEGGADKDEIMLARCKYQAQLDEYKEFSKRFGLPEQRERIYADLRGRVAPSKRTYEKWQAEQANKKISVNRSPKIDTSNKNKVLSKLKEQEQNIVNAQIEHAVVILGDGTLRKYSGDLNGVLMAEGDLKGAYVTHNHPLESDSEYSFSSSDIQFFMDNDLEILRGIDECYVYELTRNAGDLDEHMTLEELIQSEGRDARHEEVIEIARRYGIGYRRKKR